MDIIIAGAGRVGFRLAKTLSIRHNVVVIDKNANALQRLSESIDILTIYGDVEDPDTYNSLIDKDFDIFIAVTDNDELNIISTLIVDDVINVTKKIIRLRNPYFAKSSIASKLNITDAVFPFELAAKSIRFLFDFPKANNVKNFIFTDFKLVSLAIKLKDDKKIFIQDIPKDIIVAGLERDKKFILPSLNDKIELKEEDLIYLFGEAQKIKEICLKLNYESPKEIKKVAIFGSNLLGIEIAKALVDKKIDIKIIDNDDDLCKKASEILQDNATIINSKYIEQTIFEEENLLHADMVISTSSKDEDNIIKSLEAKEWGIKKIVAINNNMEFYHLMHQLGIIPARGPKASAYYSIIEKISSTQVIVQRNYCGGRATMVMRKIFANSLLIGKSIKPLKLDDAKCYVLRDNQIKIFDKKLILKENDVITIFLKSYQESKVEKWISNL